MSYDLASTSCTDPNYYDQKQPHEVNTIYNICYFIQRLISSLQAWVYCLSVKRSSPQLYSSFSLDLRGMRKWRTVIIGCYSVLGGNQKDYIFWQGWRQGSSLMHHWLMILNRSAAITGLGLACEHCEIAQLYNYAIYNEQSNMRCVYCSKLYWPATSEIILLTTV